jgi:hypothetical protein
VTFSDEVIARLARSSLAEIASGAFLVPGEAAPTPEDVERIVDGVLEAVAEKNQFAASEPKLEAGVRKALEGLATEGVEKTKAALAAVFEEVLGPSPAEVPSATYSPDLQLAVLGLSALREPILDVGCGKDAALVKFLRARGQKADGIDLRAPAEATRASWLGFDYGAARWGTITSHLGFTLHFMHQEMKRSELAFDYARAYMRIVKALAPGGTFAYIPGVPFIESMLPKALRVERVALAEGLVTDAVKSVQQATGLVLDAATHVIARP